MWQITFYQARNQTRTQIETGIHAKDRSQGIATTWEDGLDPYAGHGPSTGHSQGLCAAKNQELMEGI